MTQIYIERISAIWILNSAGNPTVEVSVQLSDRTNTKLAVPSGTSKGAKEAHELLDGDMQKFSGQGVKKAVANVNSLINDRLQGCSPFNQQKIDRMLIDLDGTQNKSNLGANAILGTSLAVAQVAAKSLKMDFFRYLGGIYAGYSLPTPMINVINGGAHSNNNLQIQEFMLVPQKNNGQKIADLIEKSCNVYANLKKILQEKGMSTNVGLEGGFAPNLQKTEQALELLCQAIETSGYKLQEDFCFALDVAANDFYYDDKQCYEIDGNDLDAHEMIEFYQNLLSKYPICSIEDPLSENDLSGWIAATEALGNKIMLVGDDLFATNINYLKKYSGQKIANSILIKPNQIGTLSETFEVMRHTREIDYQTVVSHRSAENNDAFLIHLAIAAGSKFIKIGAPARGERVAKFNELLCIESMLND